MAITYSAGVGTTITTHAMNETLPASQPSDLSQVRVSDDLSTAGNGQIGSGATPGSIGNSYVGRLLIINIAGTQQRRMCVGETDEGTTFLLDIHEPWDTQPVGSTDTIHVPYEAGDIEDGGVSSGVGYTTRTGYYTYSNDLTIAVGGGLQIMNGTAWEMDDAGSNITFFHQSGGYFYSGYESGGSYIAGGLILFVNNTATEPSYQAQSGSIGYMYDFIWWAQLVAQQIEHANGSAIEYYGSKLLNFTNECHLYDSVLRDVRVYGKGGTTEIVRVDAGTDCDGLILSNVDTLQGPATADTKTLKNVNFAGVTDLITLINSDIWNMINPIWTATLHSDFNSAAVTGSATINDRTEVSVTVKEADGTLLQNALVNVYEHTTLADLVLELTTDADGHASDSFIYLAHIWTTGTGATTTYGSHARQVGKWLYLPAVFAQSSTDEFIGDVVLSPDNNINQTVQATAKSAGLTVTWNEDTNPSELFDFTSGSGTLADGMILTFSPSGAVGTITKSMSGDSTAGEIHLSTRNATAIANGDTFSRTGGTAGTFSGTYTNDSKQPFTIWIDGQNLGLQVIYDYLAAIQNETTLTADGELIWEWCRSAQSQPLYATGSSFYTERSNGKGIIIIDAGAGTSDYYTDDAGNTWTAPVSTTVTFATMKDSSEVRVYLTGTSTEIAGIEDATAGTSDNRTFAWAATASTVVDYVIHNWDGVEPHYQTIRVNGYTVPASNTTINIAQQLDRNAE